MKEKSNWDFKLSAKYGDKPVIKLYTECLENDYKTIEMCLIDLCFDLLKNQYSYNHNEIKKILINTINEEF